MQMMVTTILADAMLDAMALSNGAAGLLAAHRHYSSYRTVSLWGI
eukprot:SAG22_NODE_2129_length_2969_cov_6.022997_2_plen_45_part_00